MDIQALLDKVKEYVPPEKQTLLREAYEFASKCHNGQVRLSGEPYLEHPLNVALLLADLHQDTSTLAAALLHDVSEDCGVSLDEIEKRFGPEVRKLVDGATKLSKIEAHVAGGKAIRRTGRHQEATQAESLRKMLVAMAKDIRVVLIKLADRLHNMRTLNALPQESQMRIARETLDIYAPLAHRLGIWNLKWQLEDLAFRHLEPDRYREISKLVAVRRQEREGFIEKVTQILKADLVKNGLPAEVTGRAKHIYSIYKKSNKYAAAGKDLSDIYDLFAVRVLVDTVEDCYRALGVVHSLWRPLPGQFDDYIGNPKDNRYQALHSTVMGPEGHPLEVQIRTNGMHQIAEYGVAAHWHYKEGGSKDVKFEERMTWLRQLLEWQRDVAGAEEFLDSVKTDIFQDQVFVYTPKGDIVELPQGATPLDFAYRIHTDLGHKCVGAKSNGRMVPLDYQLRNGDTVEILTSKTSHGPSLDWLNPDLGYIRTAHAREKARQWFRRRERTENVQHGAEILDRESRRLAMDLDEEEMAKLFQMHTGEEFLAALGSGQVTTFQLEAKVLPQEHLAKPRVVTPLPTESPPGVQVMGVDNLLTQVAKCCHPIPGDEVVGFITRSRGITIHRASCYNLHGEKEKERIVKVEWGPTNQVFPVQVHVESWDRVGLLRDLTTLVAEEKVNISGASSTEMPDKTVSISLTLHITSVAQLSKLFAKLESVKGVLAVRRVIS